MFQFPRFPSSSLCVQDKDTARAVGFPIRISPDRRLYTAPRGFSQCPTSFFGIWHQGILRKPFVASLLVMRRTHSSSLHLTFLSFLGFAFLAYSLVCKIVHLTFLSFLGFAFLAYSLVKVLPGVFFTRLPDFHPRTVDCPPPALTWVSNAGRKSIQFIRTIKPGSSPGCLP